MEKLRRVREGGVARRVTGECHAVANLTERQKLDCLRELRGQRCTNGVTYYLTCREAPRPPRNASRALKVPFKMPVALKMPG